MIRTVVLRARLTKLLNLASEASTEIKPIEFYFSSCCEDKSLPQRVICHDFAVARKILVHYLYIRYEFPAHLLASNDLDEHNVLFDTRILCQAQRIYYYDICNRLNTNQIGHDFFRGNWLIVPHFDW